MVTISYPKKCLLLLFIICPCLCHALQPDDQSIDNFGLDSKTISSIPTLVIDKKMEIYGSFQLGGSFRTATPHSYPYTQPNGLLAELKGEFDLMVKRRFASQLTVFAHAEVSHDFAIQINGSDEYPEEYKSDVEKQFELKEAWLEKSVTPWFDFKLGRQIVPWGTSETLRVVDVVNPLDLRNFGMTDIEDIRLAQTMSRFDFYSGPWDITALIIHETRQNKIPVEGSDFYLLDQPFPPVLDPESSLENTQFAVSITGRFKGCDTGLYLAQVYDHSPYLEFDSNLNPVLKYSKIKMLGATGVFPVKNFLFRTEVAFLDDLKFSSIPGKEKSGLDVLLGADFSGLKNTIISVEFVNRHIFSFEPVMVFEPARNREDQLEYVFRINRTFMNETVSCSLVAAFAGEKGEDGSFQRIDTEYKWSDNTTLTLGAIFYHGGDNIIYEKIKNNDRVFCAIKWSFL